MSAEAKVRFARFLRDSHFCSFVKSDRSESLKSLFKKKRKSKERQSKERQSKERKSEERKNEERKSERAKSERANSLPCALFSLYCMVRTERNADPTVAVELPVVGGHLQQGLLHVAEKWEARFPIIMLQLFFN